MIESKISVINFNGNPLHFRDGTSDSLLININLLDEDISKREYLFPKEIQPKVILDIGANIGVTSILLDHCYPGAKIFAFEPDKENFNLLEKNVENYLNIVPLNYGLSDITQKVELYDSEDQINFGGLSTVKKGNIRDIISVMNVNQALRELNINAVDLIKIDCEGAEYDIFKVFNPEILSQVEWIEGEFHNHKEYDILKILEDDFKFSFNKSFGDMVWNFKAINKKTLDRIQNENK